MVLKFFLSAALGGLNNWIIVFSDVCDLDFENDESGLISGRVPIFGRSGVSISISE